MPNYLSPGVYVEEVEAGSRPIEGVGTAVAAFVGIAADGPFNQPTLVANWGQFTKTFGQLVPGAYMPLSVYQYFNNGGGAAYIVRVGGDGGSVGAAPKARGELTSATKAGVGTYRVEALNAGAEGDDLTVSVTLQDSPPAGEGDAPAGEGDEAFTISVKQGGKVVESFENLVAKKGKQNVATVVNELSKLIRITEIGSASVPDRLPAVGDITLSGGRASAVPDSISSEEYVGDPAARTGFGGLEAIEEVTMLAVPDLMSAYESGAIDLEGVQAVQQAMIDHCELMGNRVAILDTPPALNAQQVKEWRVEKTGYDSKYATMYWPWVKVFDAAEGGMRMIPPSGAIAGIWGRSDDTRGVWKAPANEIVRGTIDVELNITRVEHDLLNPVGINVIRSFPGRGIRVWGARTLSSDPAWRYLNVRRLFNFIEGSILVGTQWVVFEPNDLDLWQRIRRTISSFLLRLWRDGALFGATPDEAYYVKCDSETNPPDVVDAGQVIVEIGIAPVKPAEFVVFRLAQFSAGAAIEE
jgi:phage tail sheath protein FI